MTHDKRRLAEIRKACGPYREDECGKSSEIGVALFLLRLLDEAIAERDAAMAALRELTTMLRLRPDISKMIGPAEIAVFNRAESMLAAHSAATKPTEAQE